MLCLILNSERGEIREEQLRRYKTEPGTWFSLLGPVLMTKSLS